MGRERFNIFIGRERFKIFIDPMQAIRSDRNMAPFGSQQFYFCIIAYLIGAIPFGVIVSRFVMGEDIRKHGSGNIGATNIARKMGKKWGILVLFLDALKGYVVTKIALTAGAFCFAPGQCPDSGQYANLIAVIAVLGHCYPVYLKFRGGKGVATALGVILAISPLMIGIAFVAFAIALAASRRVSVGSLAAALVLPLATYFVTSDLRPWSAWIIALIVWWKHSQNIQRLIRGQEPRFF